ncbi:glycoside hydrolase family 57 protein [Fodinicola feengrottensis]|uniref:Glycoside hydrolase family 57 protein n=1 Tax=Fodinicola feengrottensis TaxID=435914 RepID=A0ABP4T9C6_9ACTN
MSQPVGTFCLVLHTHLPWLPHAGTWPVGEEWTYQAFTASWQRVVRVIEALDRPDVLTLGITPTVAAMLDDPYTLRELHTWIANWQLRAAELAGRPEPHLKSLASYEWRAASACLDDFESRWMHGGSPVLGQLASSGTVELLGGPAMHPFQPLLPSRLQRFALAVGLDDARQRYGFAPAGIWAPECGYRPGLEASYVDAGVQRFLIDGPAVQGQTHAAYPVVGTDVVAFARDLEVTYRVWSPKAGYPGSAPYRDFHTFDHASGFRPVQVTGKHLPSEAKKPWDPAAGAAQASADADDFVARVRDRLVSLADQHGQESLVVAAYDTELFGHWWHEGPQWLAAVLRRLPEAGVRVTTLGGALAAGHLGPEREIPASSWGSGKDWRVWDGEQVADLVADNAKVADRLLSTVDDFGTADRDPVLDQLATEALLALSSDWAFMVTKDSAAHYARCRAAKHAAQVAELADLLYAGHRRAAETLAAQLRVVDGPFAHLDARQL